jgi:hypothetical protein
MDHRYGLKESWSTRLAGDLRETLVRPLRNTPLYRKIRDIHQGKSMKPHRLWGASMTHAKTRFHDTYTEGETKQFALPQPWESKMIIVMQTGWRNDRE